MQFIIWCIRRREVIELFNYCISVTLCVLLVFMQIDIASGEKTCRNIIYIKLKLSDEKFHLARDYSLRHTHVGGVA